MIDTTTSAPTTLVLRRTFNASRERLFDAWTDPNVACQFLCPDGVRAVVEMDARVDGAYRIDMHLSNGSIMGVRGVFRELRRPEKIVMTWDEEAADGEHDTLLTIEFFERANGTELVLTHENFSSEGSRDAHGHGWSSILRKCETFTESGVAADVDLEDLTAHASVYLAASPERVFRALVSDEITAWWVRPGIFDTREFAGDPRVGGTYRASGVGRGQPYAIEGEYLVVDAPHVLVHTWKGSGAPHAPSTVTYTLTPIDGGTRLALRHDGLPNEDVCANTGKAWETSFAALAQRLGSYERDLTIAAGIDTVYDALTMLDGLSGWWSSVTGSPEPAGELTFTFSDVERKTIRVEAASRPTRVKWLVLSSTAHADEWPGTTIEFTLTDRNGATHLHFKHAGLTPKLNCFSDCNAGWDYFMRSLTEYVTTGKGTPFAA